MTDHIRSRFDKRLLASCAAAVIVSMPGFNTAAHAQGAPVEPPKAGAQAGKPAALSTADTRYFRQIAEANLAEVATAKIALAKSANDGIKKFAQHMIDDHGKSLAELETLAQAKNVKLPTQPDAAHRAAAKKMEGMSSEDFDRSYIAQAGLGDHRTTRKLLQQVGQKARDADLKAFAEKMLPVVESHLQMAQQMQGRPKPPPPQARASL